MKKLASTALLSLSAFALSAQAEPVKFAGVNFGTSVSAVEYDGSITGSADENTDASSTYSLAFGIKERTFRLYGEGSFENNEFANTSMITFNADYIYAIPSHNKASLFAGASMGHATLNWDEDNAVVKSIGLDGESDDSFVYGAKIGAKYMVIPKAEVEFGYRQIYTSLKSEGSQTLQNGQTDFVDLSVDDTALTYVGVNYAF